MSGVKKIFFFVLVITLFMFFSLFLLRIFHIDVPFFEFTREITPAEIQYSFAIGTVRGEDPFRLRETDEVENPILTAEDVVDVDALFVADPFMVHEDGIWHMFFEVLNRQTGQGDIGLAVSSNGIQWEYKKIVLDEPFHLSYPLVFLSDDDYYMIPEANVTDEIRLYKSTDFPVTWEYQATLMKGLPFADSTIFQHENKWWIFTTTDPSGMSTLRLYVADRLLGPWKEHPASPIIQGDANIARPAGRVLSYKHQLFRLTQDDWPTYGNRVRIFQIDELTATAYEEHELSGLPDIQQKEGKDKTWRSDGFHHLDLHLVGQNQWFGCMDGVVISRSQAISQWVAKFHVPFTKKVVQ